MIRAKSFFSDHSVAESEFDRSFYIFRSEKKKTTLPVPVSSVLKNPIFFFFVNCCVTFLIFANVLAQSFFNPHSQPNNYFNERLIRVTLVSLSSLSVFSGWALFFCWVFKQKNAQIISTDMDHQVKSSLKSNILHASFVLSSTIFFCMLLIFRSAAKDCRITYGAFLPDWSCNPYHEVPIFPMDTALLLALVPSTYAVVMKEKRVYLTVSSWILSVFGMIIGNVLTKSTSGILIIIFYTMLSWVVFIDSFRVHSYMNDLYENLKVSVEQNQQLLDQQKVNQMKDVIGNVSHDLKTPLSSFMQGIDFMLDSLTEFEQKLPPDTLKHDSFHQFFSEMKMHMKNIKNTNAFMLLTINRTIDFAKASKGLKLIPHLDTIDLLETLSLPLNCMKNIQDRIKISLLPIDSQIYNYIVTDKQWLQENVLCLLSNAVKYSTGGEVTVSVSLETDPQLGTAPSSDRSDQNNSSTNSLSNEKKYSLRFGSLKIPSVDSLKDSGRESATYLLVEVEDTGIGLSKEKMETLFSPFSQAQKLAGGTGLGLYSMSKRIESLGGKFGVRERKDGKSGSLFWFTIPYRPDQSVTQMGSEFHYTSSKLSSNKGRRLSIDDQSFQAMMKKRQLQKLSSSNLQPFQLSHKASNPKFELQENNKLRQTLNVLLVEDSPTIAKMTSMLLKKMGFHVSTAENGHIGLNMMMSADDEKKKYDLVLMDFQMPVMDGLEATRRYREYEKQKSFTPTKPQLIIGLSATFDTEIINDALLMGLDDYLMKPISSDSIQKMLKKFRLI